MSRQYDFISSEDMQKVLDRTPSFKCPVCKEPMLERGQSGLLCPACSSNQVGSNGFEVRLSEAVAEAIASEPGQEALAGLARVHLHWHLRESKAWFMNGMADEAGRLIEYIFVQHAIQSIFETSIHCSSCEEPIRDSNIDDPLVCNCCGGRDVEARNAPVTGLMTDRPTFPEIN